MLLYIFQDGTSRHVVENPTVADMLAVAQGILKVYKFDMERKRFLTLVRDEDTMEWVPVREAKAVTNSNGRIHL